MAVTGSCRMIKFFLKGSPSKKPVWIDYKPNLTYKPNLSISRKKLAY